MPKAYYGAMVNPIDPAKLDFLPNALVAVTDDGLIAWFERDVHSSLVQDVMAQHTWIDAPVIQINSDEWLMPGFVDTHTASHLFPKRSRIITSAYCTACPPISKHRKVSIS